MDKKKYDVVAIGELLIDFTHNELNGENDCIFKANPGGAPCNVLSMLQNLGKKTAFIGKVGNDFFGRMLKDAIVRIGIDTANLLFDREIPTTLAFVHNDPNGEREFSFYRKPGADIMLSPQDINIDLLKQTKIFHFGSLSMTDYLPREATIKAISTAKAEGAFISFDPNLRPSLWDTMESAKVQIKYGLSQCDILKISEEELEFITEENDMKKGIAVLREQYDISLIAVTMGERGSRVFYKKADVFIKGYAQKNVIDTTGAGDTFCACMLNYVLEHGLEDLTEKMLSDMLQFCNSAASLITAKKGALMVMPKEEEVIANMYGNAVSVNDLQNFVD